MLHTQKSNDAHRAAPEYQRLTVRRHDRKRGKLVGSAGETDLTHVIFCDISGLNAFLDATRPTTAAGGHLRLENLCPMLTRLLALTETRPLLAIHGQERRPRSLPAGPPRLRAS